MAGSMSVFVHDCTASFTSLDLARPLRPICTRDPEGHRGGPPFNPAYRRLWSLAAEPAERMFASLQSETLMRTESRRLSFFAPRPQKNKTNGMCFKKRLSQYVQSGHAELDGRANRLVVA